MINDFELLLSVDDNMAEVRKQYPDYTIDVQRFYAEKRTFGDYCKYVPFGCLQGKLLMLPQGEWTILVNFPDQGRNYPRKHLQAYLSDQIHVHYQP